ncbi:dsDNA nuclease domain-containing protein [Salinicoccus roseus]|uniref:dsDNA nuclease domain-containing protein n=1 Tax=Salinicoccus roseus TaxID=45670 RepID=UPI002300A796|nr:dsDNA nuclease domain-containing protein [Salinicoccus roseus]
MNLKDKVSESLCNKDVSGEAQYDDFINKIKDSKAEEVLDDLLNIPTKEDGGRIALTGFHYQFLVFLEYWAMMLDGEWDFIALELHEDIVLSKDNRIRFVQVKSSKETEKRASETIGKRSAINENGRKVGEYNDSWIDKLVEKAKYFKKTDGYITEFELITSFIILDSNNLKIKKYRTKSFPSKIEKSDDLVKFMSKELRDRDGNEISYESESGEDISELLSRFKISKRNDLDMSQAYENHILMTLSSHLGPGAKLTQEDMMMLVGRLMKMCDLYQDKLMLYITEEKSEDLLNTLDDIAAKRAEEHAQLKGSFSFLEDVFANLTEQFKGTNLFEEINKYILMYKAYISEWIKEGGTRRELINRYIDGNKYSSVYKHENIDLQKQRLFDFFSVNLLLILAHNDVAKFSSQYKSLLVKEVEDKYLGFLSLNRGDNIDKAIEKAEFSLRNYEELHERLNPPKTIVQGDFIRSRGSIITKELPKEVLDDNKINGLSEGFQIDDVNPVLHLIPGGKLIDEFNNIFEYNEFGELEKDLKKMWSEYL